MSEQAATTDPKPPTDPRKPCAICGSTAHTTGYHDGGVAPAGYHDGGLVAEGFGKTSTATDGDDDGYHDGGSPAK
jgi:hypothetical protein